MEEENVEEKIEELEPIKKYNQHYIQIFKNKKVDNRIFYGGLFLLLVFLGFCIYNLLLLPTISLKGSRYQELSFGEEYKELGYKASFLGQDYTKDVTVNNKINLEKLGTYDIIYEIKVGVFKKQVIRKVKIIDDVKPVITLVSLDDIYVCPGKKYTKEEYKALDNYDGDITDKVVVNEEENKITYTVSDSSNNKVDVTRNILYEDKTNPVLELKGNETITVYQNNKYSEPGYKATDNCDLDITDKVKVDSNVNTSKIGEYTITYTSIDSSNNKATLTRKVKVVKKPTGGIIYLTFDDGPNQGTTNVILDILKEEGVKATFFVTGKGPDSLIKREYDEGHTVALHTYSHDYAIYKSVDTYFNDLNKISDRVERITGVKSKIIRFPGGSSNTVSRQYSNGIMTKLTKEVINRGYHYFDWNISSGDAGNTTDPKRVYKNVVNSLSRSRNNVVLMHDIKTYTRDALRDIIRYGKENGYTFEAITYDTPMVRHGVNN